MAGSLAADGGWRSIEGLPDDIEARMNAAICAEIDALGKFLDDFRPISMPQLDTVVMGQFDASHTWASLFEVCRRRRDLRGIRHRVFELIRKLDPRVICSHSGFSPYAPSGHGGSETTKLKTICTHHNNGFDDYLNYILAGTSNRHYCSPNANFEAGGPPGPTSWRGYQIHQTFEDVTERHWESSSPGVRALLPKTEVELYGFGSPPEVAQQATQEVQAGPTGDAPMNSGVDRVNVEDAVHSTLVNQLDETLHKRWKGKFMVRSWHEIPPCEACDWSTENWRLSNAVVTASLSGNI